jgi:hypothetical protein
MHDVCMSDTANARARKMDDSLEIVWLGMLKGSLVLSSKRTGVELRFALLFGGPVGTGETGWKLSKLFSGEIRDRFRSLKGVFSMKDRLNAGTTYLVVQRRRRSACALNLIPPFVEASLWRANLPKASETWRT